LETLIFVFSLVIHGLIDEPELQSAAAAPQIDYTSLCRELASPANVPKIENIASDRASEVCGKAIDIENPTAEVKFLLGRSLVEDHAEAALVYLQSSADEEYADALMLLAEIYQDGLFGQAKDFDTQNNYLERAALSGSVEAAESLFFGYYLAADEVPEFYSDAFKWAVLAAKLDSAQAHSTLGFMFQIGQGVGQNYGKAASWHEKAGEMGMLDNYRFAAMIYDNGHGNVAQDPSKAAILYMKAAKGGLLKAQTEMGRRKLSGIGVPIDISEGLSFLKTAVDRGDSRAQFLLGLEYLIGDSVERDQYLGRQLLEQAASQDEEDAISLLKQMDDL